MEVANCDFQFSNSSLFSWNIGGEEFCGGGGDAEPGGSIKPQGTVVVYMTGREVEKDRVGVRCDGFKNRCIDGVRCMVYGVRCTVYGVRCFHAGVGVAVGELTDDETFEACEDAGHAEIVHHAVDMIMPLAYILNEQYAAFGMRIQHGIQAVRRSLQAVKDAEIAADECAFCVTVAVQRMRRQAVRQVIPE